MIVPAVNVLWDFTSQFSALMPLMLSGFVKWSDVGSNSRVFLLCLFASLALGSIEIQDDPQFQQDMVAFLVSMVLFCFVSRVVFAFGWRASSGTAGFLRTEASNHVRFRWLVIMNPIVCGEWQEITYSSGATICSPWMSLTCLVQLSWQTHSVECRKDMGTRFGGNLAIPGNWWQPHRGHRVVGQPAVGLPHQVARHLKRPDRKNSNFIWWSARASLEDGFRAMCSEGPQTVGLKLNSRGLREIILCFPAPFAASSVWQKIPMGFPI